MSSSSAAHDAKKSAKKKRIHVDTTTAAAAEQKRAKKAPAAVASAVEEEPVVSSGAVVEAVVARPAEVKKKIGRPRKLPLPDGAPPPPKKKYQRRKPLGAGPQQRAQRTTKRADADADAAAVPLPPGPPPLELLHQRRARHREQWLATLLAAAEKGGEGEGVDDDDDVVGGVAALQRLAVNLERGAYNHALTAARRRRLLVHPGCPVFWRLYVARTCALWRNMRSCPALMHSVRVGALAPRELETLSTMQLDLGHWREELEAKSKRDGSRFATRLVANTTEYTCRACGSTRCSYFEIQLRKADEPSDVFITCIDCSFRWKDDM